MKLELHSKIRENIPFDKHVPIRIFRGYDQGKSMIIPHMHEAIEIIYISHGNLQIMDSSNFSILQAGEFHIFNSNDVHSTKFDGDLLKGIILQISFDLIKNLVPDAAYYKFYFSKGSENKKEAVIHLMKSLLLKSECEKKFDFFKIYGDLMYLLNILFSDFSERISTKSVQSNQKYYKRIFKINNYIEQNYANTITLTTLSKQVHLNPEYLSRFISKNYGMSFYRYLTSVRLNHAQTLITTTDLQILQIAEQTGFANYAQFNKEFKNRFGCLPSRIRQKN
ncbi:helix-turn-helix domain-containing protein [Companilactobacillus formosensis]|uniref:helix-turn-helix domain-containing protein n=1 Tax=Companilactobacillus formosensis TaxID=1617889 RepID=UPI000E650D90|nr:AraC family transcriptional regulator [Companilactobacillus formosensis]